MDKNAIFWWAGFLACVGFLVYDGRNEQKVGNDIQTTKMEPDATTAEDDTTQKTQTGLERPQTSQKETVQRSQTKTGSPPPLERAPAKAGVVDRILGDHFRTHPSAEDRLLHLTSLSTKRKIQPRDLIDVFNKIKRNGIDMASDMATVALGKFSLEREWEIGALVHQELCTKMKVDRQAGLRLQSMAQPLLEKVERTKGMPYRFYVVKENVFNAFAHVGGHIYVYQGLIDKLPDKTDLMFVLAHEIAHVEREHCAKATLFSEKAAEFAGEPGRVASRIAQMVTRVGYSYQNEKDADSWAYWRLKEHGKTDTEIFGFFKTLAAEEKKRR